MKGQNNATQVHCTCSPRDFGANISCPRHFRRGASAFYPWGLHASTAVQRGREPEADSEPRSAPATAGGDWRSEPSGVQSAGDGAGAQDTGDGGRRSGAAQFAANFSSWYDRTFAGHAHDEADAPDASPDGRSASSDGGRESVPSPPGGTIFGRSVKCWEWCSGAQCRGICKLLG